MGAEFTIGCFRIHESSATSGIRSFSLFGAVPIDLRSKELTSHTSLFQTDLTSKICESERLEPMKYAGLLVMPTGFFLAIAALVLFADPGKRAAFVTCGVLVEILGLVVAVRGHMLNKGDARP